jgi:hypothetical protein
MPFWPSRAPVLLLAVAAAVSLYSSAQCHGAQQSVKGSTVLKAGHADLPIDMADTPRAVQPTRNISGDVAQPQTAGLLESVGAEEEEEIIVYPPDSMPRCAALVHGP